MNKSSNICTRSCESDESARKENFGRNISSLANIPLYPYPLIHICSKNGKTTLRNPMTPFTNPSLRSCPLPYIPLPWVVLNPNLVISNQLPFRLSWVTAFMPTTLTIFDPLLVTTSFALIAHASVVANNSPSLMPLRIVQHSHTPTLVSSATT